MAFTASKFQGASFAPDSRRSPYLSELVKLQGATGIVGDTATYKPQAGTPVAIVGGAFRIDSVTAGEATIEAKVALGDDDVVVEMLCIYQ